LKQIFAHIFTAKKLDDFFVKVMNPRQRQYAAMHADNFKEEIAEKIARRD
jgi:hypothetical protein